MRIQTKIIAGAGIAALIAVMLALTLWITFDRAIDEIRKQELAYSVHKTVAELGVITYEYLIHYEKRMERQWFDKFGSVTSVLNVAAKDVGNREYNAIINSLRTDFTKIGTLFSEVVLYQEKLLKLLEEGAPQQKTKVVKRYEEQLVTRLLLSYQTVISTASKYEKMTLAKTQKVRTFVHTVLLAFIFIFVATSLSAVFYLIRWFSAPLRMLTGGAKIIGQGNLEYQVPIKTKDEFGGLAEAFNQMANNLKRLTASRDKLDKDIIEKKKAEEALLAAKEAAESISRAKSEFLANMSHEIRTPLNAIIGMAELLKETPLSDAQQEFVRILEAGGDSLLSIVNDIIDLSKVEAGRLELENIDFNLMDLVEGVCSMLAINAHEKKLELHHDLAVDVPVLLRGDPVRLRQILVNLISNGIKFTNFGEVIAKCEVTGAPKEGVELLFSVSDTGLGIPGEKLEDIFKRFVQVDTTTTREFGGTGLGLTISKRLVELMGGAIWVESETGKGSTFYFTARLDLPKGDLLPVGNVFKPISGVKALIIDDNGTNRLILARTLMRWKIDTAEAEDGPTGLSMLRTAVAAEDPFDLILLDGCMPGMDGFHVAETLRRDPVLKSMPIMMLTSDERRINSARYEEIGVTMRLTKPVRSADLFIAISKLMGENDILPDLLKQTARMAFSFLEPARLLLVEDYIHNRMIVEKYLKETPFQIDIAENGSVAVEKFKTGNYDLILMDLQMPVMDGLTATRKIRQLEKERDKKRVPVIALTAFALKEDVEKSLGAGCDGHLGKPVRKQQLLEVLGRYFPYKGQKKACVAPPATIGVQKKQSDCRIRLSHNFVEFIPIFIEDIKKDTGKMLEALKRQDYETIRKKSHSIKGAGGGYGLHEISRIAERIEQEAKDQKGKAVGNAVQTLQDYVDSVEIEYE